MRVGYIQTSPHFGDLEGNLDRALSQIKRASSADLLVLPELFSTGYLFSSRSEAMECGEDVPDGPTTGMLSEAARECSCITVGGVPERCGDYLFNSAVLCTPDGEVHVYRKMHLFMEELTWFDPGNLGFKVVHLPHLDVRVGLMVCFDWLFPETMRILTLAGADIICHPSNLVLPHCQQSMITRCLENAVFAVTTNRVGTDSRPSGEVSFTGRSQVVGSKGDILARASDTGEAEEVVTIDPAEARDKYFTPHNHILLSRRPAYYAPLTESNGIDADDR